MRDTELAMDMIHSVSEKSGSSRVSRKDIDDAIQGRKGDLGNIPSGLIKSDLFKMRISNKLKTMIHDEDSKKYRAREEQMKRA